MSEPAEEEVAAKVMPAPIAEAILRAWDGRRLTLASAKPVVRAWMRAHGWSEDRWGNFKINETTRFHFGKQVFRKERNLGGYWQGLDSRPMIDAANVLLGKAAAALGREPELAKITKAKAARREEKAERRTKAEEDRLLAQARDWTMKYIAQELPEDFVAWKTTGEQGEEFKARANELHTQIKSQLLAGGHFSDGEIVSSDSPPIGAFFDERLKYSWEETAGGVRYTIDVIPRGTGKVAVHIGKPTASGFGQRVDPTTMSMSWEMTMSHEGDGYLTGQVIRTKDGVGASLFMLIAHEKQRGAGGRMLDLWCTMLSAYGVEDWVAEAVGDEGQAFIEKKAASGRLELLARRGTNLFVRCVDQAGTAPERMMPNTAEPAAVAEHAEKISAALAPRLAALVWTVAQKKQISMREATPGYVERILQCELPGLISSFLVAEPDVSSIDYNGADGTFDEEVIKPALAAVFASFPSKYSGFSSRGVMPLLAKEPRLPGARELLRAAGELRSAASKLAPNTAAEYRDAVAAKLAPILGAALAHEVAANFASVMLYGDDTDARSALEVILRHRMQHPETYQAEHLTEAMVQKARDAVVGDDALRDGDLLRTNAKKKPETQAELVARIKREQREELSRMARMGHLDDGDTEEEESDDDDMRENPKLVPGGFSGFDVFDVDSEEETAPALPGRDALRDLRRDDLFRIGGRGPVFRVVQSYDDTTKSVVKQGTAGRTLYVTRPLNRDSYEVSVFATTGGSLEPIGESIVKPGLVVKVGAEKNPKVVNNGSSFADRLAAVRILFRAPETLALWGIPYELRPGQSPRDLWDSTSITDTLAAARGVYGATIRTPGPREGWVLISPAPGWWGNMSREDQAEAKVFIAEHKESIPGHAYEWAVL